MGRIINTGDPFCGRLECFANRGTGHCRCLVDTHFENRGGKAEGEKCPFFKTVREAKNDTIS